MSIEEPKEITELEESSTISDQDTNDVLDVRNEIRNASPELIKEIVDDAKKELSELYVTYSEEPHPDFCLWNDMPPMDESGRPDWNPSIGLAQSAEGLSSDQLRQLIDELDAQEVFSQGNTTLYVIHS